jgi:hypothetical protein
MLSLRQTTLTRTPPFTHSRVYLDTWEGLKLGDTTYGSRSERVASLHQKKHDLATALFPIMCAKEWWRDHRRQSSRAKVRWEKHITAKFRRHGFIIHPVCSVICVVLVACNLFEFLFSNERLRTYWWPSWLIPSFYTPRHASPSHWELSSTKRQKL